MLIFCMGIGLVLSALSVYFRDIMHLYGVFTMAWMYATPIFYPVESLPDVVRWFVVHLNPLYFYVAQFRDIIYYQQMPHWGLVLAGCISALLMLVFGIESFVKKQDRFILYI